MKKSFLLLALLGALITGCYSIRSNAVHTKLQTYEIDQQIVAGKTSQKEILKTFGSRYSAEIDTNGREMWVYNLAISIPTAIKHPKQKIEFITDYQRNRNKNDLPFSEKYEGFSPEFDLKEYLLAIFFDEEGRVISFHLDPKDSTKTPSWQSFDRSLSK
ncbi:MAG: hypothetical protein KFB93_07420 [Simkaniaceae bacterium]|nr:MAG: hypothetical protein KFB93_07420 [Simkaniaceae bacterium]